jgi:hypothetical protein
VDQVEQVGDRLVGIGRGPDGEVVSFVAGPG